jgi:hypothetical protein
MSILGAKASTRRITIGVAGGVLAAAAVIFGVWQASQPSDFDCAVQHADVQLGNLQPYEVDDACR